MTLSFFSPSWIEWRLDHRDEVAAQGAGVGRRCEVDVALFMQATASSTSSAFDAQRRYSVALPALARAATMSIVMPS